MATRGPKPAGLGSPARLRATRPRFSRHAADASRWPAPRTKGEFVNAPFLASRLIVAIQALALAACVASPGTSAPLPAVSSPVASRAAEPILDPSPTHLPATKTPSPTATTDTRELAHLRIACLPISEDPTLMSPSLGNLLLTSSGSSATDLYVQDLSTQRVDPIFSTNERIFDPSVAPDRNHVAYLRVTLDRPNGEIQKEEVVTTDRSGQVQTATMVEEHWTGLPGWLDVERVLIVNATHDDYTREETRDLIAFTPSTGEKVIVNTQLPDLYDFHPLPWWKGLGIVAPNPDLSRAIYLSWYNGQEYAYALWDSDVGRALSYIGPFDFERTPKWSPSGDRAIVAANLIQAGVDRYELFLFKPDGTVAPVTQLTAHFQTTYIQSYSWSPDGQRIAFWLNTDTKGPYLNETYGAQRLAILDLQSGTVTDYCVPGDESTTRYEIVPAPIWSPDGSQLVVMDRLATDESRVILVDPGRKGAVVVANNMRPVGWLNP